jgi:hypothetical protein
MGEPGERDEHSDTDASKRQRDPGRDGGPGKGERVEEVDELRGRVEWLVARRRGKDGELAPGVFGKAIAKRRSIEKKVREQQLGREDFGPPVPPGGAGSVNWTPIGPSVVTWGAATNSGVSGRVTSIAVGPGGSRVYVGAANGGVWLSEDGGAHWRPLDDYATSPSYFAGSAEADSLAIGAVTLRFGASTASDEIFAGTGEANFAGATYFGVGIRHSLSGGAPGTWSLEATNLAGRGIYSIVIDPDDPSLVLAATSAGLFRRPASGPYTNWTQVTSAEFAVPTGRASALVVAGSGASKRYYVAFYNPSTFASGAVCESLDGATWVVVPGLTGSGRIALAVAESDPSVLYAFREDATLMRLAGGTLRAVAGPPANAIFPTGQGWYDLAIHVDPADPSTIFLGTQSPALFKGTITGGPGSYTFPFDPANAATPWSDSTYVGQGVHADTHAIAFALNAAGTAHDGTNVWVGSDGGVYQSTTSGYANTFRSRNTGLAITQTQYLAQRPDTDAEVFVGSQDNGTIRLLGEEASAEVIGGDGGGVACDQNNPWQVMREYVHASLQRRVAGSTSWEGVRFPPRIDDTAPQVSAAEAEYGNTGFYAPVVTSPAGVTPSLLAFGTYRLWLSDDWGSSWVTLPSGTNPYVTATPGDAPNAAQDAIDGTRAVMAIAFASGSRIFAATVGKIWRYDEAGGTWSKTEMPTTGLPSYRFITDLAVADAAAGTIYATLAWGTHLYYFDGTAWQVAMPTSVIDAPAHAVAVDPANPQFVYVGTDVGVWRGTKTGATTWSWILFSQGLPESAVIDLAVHERARLLRAATHGRGVWEIELDAAAGTDPDLYLRVNHADAGRTPGGARFPWVEGAADPLHEGRHVRHWMSADIKVRRPSLPGAPALNSPPDYLDFAVNIGDYVDTTSNVETADQTGPNRIFVEVHNRGLTPVPADEVRILLLVTDASVALPTLPADFTSRIAAADASLGWLAGSGWHFADSFSPYRKTPRDLDVRTPQVVDFEVDFSSMSLPLGHDHVCAAAFVTAAGDPLTGLDTNLNQLTMHDKHVAHRNLHLVAAGATPIADGSEYAQEPQTFMVEVHNQDECAEIELVVDRHEFPGELALMLPPEIADQAEKSPPSGLEVHERHGFCAHLRERLGRRLKRIGKWIERLGKAFGGGASEFEESVEGRRARQRAARKLATLDHSRVFVSSAGAESATIGGLELDAAQSFTVAISLQAPPEAKPGDRFALDIFQRRGDEIVGGSTYVVAVHEQARRRQRGGPVAALRRTVSQAANWT